jgi:hypothetical protein
MLGQRSRPVPPAQPPRHKGSAHTAQCSAAPRPAAGVLSGHDARDTRRLIGSSSHTHHTHKFVLEKQPKERTLRQVASAPLASATSTYCMHQQRMHKHNALLSCACEGLRPHTRARVHTHTHTSAHKQAPGRRHRRSARRVQACARVRTPAHRRQQGRGAGSQRNSLLCAAPATPCAQPHRASDARCCCCCCGMTSACMFGVGIDTRHAAAPAWAHARACTHGPTRTCAPLRGEQEQGVGLGCHGGSTAPARKQASCPMAACCCLPSAAPRAPTPTQERLCPNC